MGEQGCDFLGAGAEGVLKLLQFGGLLEVDCPHPAGELLLLLCLGDCAPERPGVPIILVIVGTVGRLLPLDLLDQRLQLGEVLLALGLRNGCELLLGAGLGELRLLDEEVELGGVVRVVVWVGREVPTANWRICSRRRRMESRVEL